MAPIKIMLAVDSSRKRVLFADAGSDFVDVLLSILTLPLSALECHYESVESSSGSAGCLSNLCDSVNRLRHSRLLKVEACCGTLLTPAHTDEFELCKSGHRSFFKQCKCSLVMARLLHVYEQVGSKETFVGGKQRFVISDDCTIKPASTSSMQSLTQAFGSDEIGHGFEEVEVIFSRSKVLSMLKASRSSDAVLTDVFLSTGTDNHQAARTNVKSSTNLNTEPSDPDTACSSPESKIKILYDPREKKVMYAECDHEFVDLLLGFMTYPVSSVIKNTGAGTFHLGRCFENLYRSIADLDDAGCLTGCFPKMKLLDPTLMPFAISSHAMCRALDCRCRKDTMPELTRYCCHPELVEYGRYVVGDDLLIHQASAISVMKHWRGRNKAMVLEMDIAIGKQEAVALLRAMLTSKTVLTDVFIHRLEEYSSLKKMQIFARIPMSKTITVEVTRSDTIATVKSKIKDKVSIPAGCRHELVYGSRYLNDSCTVAECNLVRECTIACEFYKSA